MLQEPLLSQYAYTVLAGVFFTASEREAAGLHALGAALNWAVLLLVRSAS